MNPLDFLIAPAYAQAATQPAAGGLFGGGLGGLLFPVALVAIMYFVMIRPQTKRQKEHRAMLEKISKGDEVITNGGIAGQVTNIGENFITVEVAAGVQLRVQKGAITSVLPRGTLKAS